LASDISYWFLNVFKTIQQNELNELCHVLREDGQTKIIHSFRADDKPR